MKKKITALVATLSICVVIAAGLAGCSAVKNSLTKLNDRVSDWNTAAAQLSSNFVRDPQVQVKSSGDNSVTVLVYMNGSNLESEAGEATNDIAEMIAAGASDNVNIIIQTMGTSEWQNYGISSKKTQRYQVTDDGLTLVDNSLKQLACTESSTLSDFIAWGAANYPADRYELILWDHGGGPVYGYGYDETGDEDDTLTLDEMQSALKNGGVYFDFIGMDCCIMSSLETCCALYDYCDYTILSEDFESGLGWSYTGWLKQLSSDPTVSTKDLGTTIVDDMVKANEQDKDWGDSAILAVMDESMMKVLFTAWTDFAYANEDTLMNNNYSTAISRAVGGRDALVTRQKGLFSDFLEYSYNDLFGSSDYEDYLQGYGSGLFSDYDEYDVSMADYYVTDIMAAAQNVDSDESSALSAALKNAIVYTNATSDESSLTGLSVTLPYGDSEFYSELKTIFTNCGIDSTYVSWLKNFVSASGADNYYDYSSWDNVWSGWGDVSSSFDWSSWGDTHSENANDDSYGWSQYNYEDSWNAWYEENSGSYQPGSGGPSGFGR